MLRSTDMPLGKWAPDDNPKTDGLVDARNFMWVAGKWMLSYGIGPVDGESSISITPDDTRALFVATDPDMTSRNFVFGSTEIGHIVNGSFSVLGSGYEETSHWGYCVFGDNVIATNYHNPVQVLNDISGGSSFVDASNMSLSVVADFDEGNGSITRISGDSLEVLAQGMTFITSSSNNPGPYTVKTANATVVTIESEDSLVDELSANVTIDESPLKAKHCVAYKDRVIYGNLKSKDCVYPTRLQIMATSTYSGTTPSEDTGAGVLDIPAPGEQILGMHEVGDSLVVHMSNSVWALRFIGYPLWFNVVKIYDGSAALCSGAVVAVDKNAHIGWGRDDLYLIQESVVTPLGAGFREYIFDEFDYSNRCSISASLDEKKKLVMFNFLTNSGSPKMLIYNYEDGVASYSDAPYDCVGSYQDSSGNIFPVAVMEQTGEQKQIITSGLAEDGYILGGDGGVMISSGESFNILALDDSLVPSGESVLETGEIDFGDVAFIREVRPILDSPSTTYTVFLNVRNDDTEPYREHLSTIDKYGVAKFRARGRYVKVGIRLSGVAHRGISKLRYKAAFSGTR